MSLMLEQRWKCLKEASLSFLDPSLVMEATNIFSAAWKTICKNYSESHRSYHTLRHLEYMYLQAQQYDMKSLQNENIFFDAYAVDFAIFFHDIVYAPESKRNEQLSADLFKQYFGNLFQPKFVATVEQFILATINHTQNLSSFDDLSFFLDLDLSIIGGTPLEYKNYATQIRYEYQHIQEDIYCHERAKFLRSMLQGRIYRTPKIAEDKEDQARRNIEWECSILESGSLISDVTSLSRN